LSDLLDRPVERPRTTETTALGAAILAALGSGAASDLAGATRIWQLDREFAPSMSKATRERLLTGWRQAVTRAL
jgi:glycerol kinase